MSGTRLFFAACLLVSAALIIALVGGTLGPRTMPLEAVSGMGVWKSNQCEGCHTLYGQGGPYAPDLTHIFTQRGGDYIREFLANPQAFHPGQRIMPSFGLTVSETDHLLAFLEWVGAQDVAETWPPQMINISGGGSLAAGVSVVSAGASGESLPDDPVARGQYWFSRPPAICGTCHALVPDTVVVGPSLAGIAERAATRVPGLSAEQYLRASILNPSDYVVEGFPDAMQKNFGSVLTSDQISDIIAFLLTQ